MAELNEAEQFLVEQVRAGSEDAWGQLVGRYQGRLVLFARSRMRNPTDVDDAVQETFISFLGGLPQFRGECSLETYLFTILQRKIINLHRGRRSAVTLLQETHAGDAGSDPAAGVAAPDPTASWYARREEDYAWQSRVLRDGLRELIEELKSSLNFRDLKIIEMLFYSQLRNKEVASIAGVRENHVALLKHRAIARIRGQVEAAEAGGRGAESDPPDELLSRIWREDRLSCLKRGTIGAYLLGTLDAAWQAYADFHLQKLGCIFCRANLEDLQAQSARQSSGRLHDRILQSSIGFLSRPGGQDRR